MKTKHLLGCILLSIGCCVYAQTPTKFNDANRDGFYDIDEFSNAYSKGYNDWDADRNGKINEQEFYDTSYNRLDVNHDGKLTHEEWTASENDFEGFIIDDAKSVNPPQYLSRNEFRDRFRNNEYYGSYDANRDGFIDMDELNKATFNRLDRNQDGKLDKGELDGF